jgi:HEAT repeat protein
MAEFAVGAERRRNPDGAVVMRLVLLFLPAGVLLVCAFLRPHWALWLGLIFQLAAIAGLRAMAGTRNWYTLGMPALFLYMTAIFWLWVGVGFRAPTDPLFHFCLAILLVVSLGVFGLQILSDSGAQEMRNARMLARRLEDRRDWPADLASCRALPEVKALREAVHTDPIPALAMLLQPRPQVRMAALGAMEFRKHWEPGQAELVLSVAQHAQEPDVRAAAIMALANVDDRLLVERLAEYLRDPSPEVRRAATEALLWNTERRWNWIRPSVRQALGDSTGQEDGPMIPNGQLLSSEAVNDLTAWAAEKGIMAIRAALTLGVHYERLLNQERDMYRIRDLQDQLANPNAATPLRMEIARLLKKDNLLPRDLHEKLLDTANPAPLRLIAAEALLAEGKHTAAVAALREVARLPNREIALATAEIVQRRLGTDLGLALGQPLPLIQSRQAADVTRRVMTWAAENDHPEHVSRTEPM